jgi:hypothetical protein
MALSLSLLFVLLALRKVALYRSSLLPAATPTLSLSLSCLSFSLQGNSVSLACPCLAEVLMVLSLSYLSCSLQGESPIFSLLTISSRTVAKI